MADQNPKPSAAEQSGDVKTPESTAPASSTANAVVPPAPSEPARPGWRWMALRREIPRWEAALLGLFCVALCFGGWWLLTRENADGERILAVYVLPSPSETFQEFPSLWFERALARNAIASLERVALGFALALVIGVPLGVLCGCFPWINSFLAPVTIFGRNIPLAALIPLTFAFFGTGQEQRIMFIFIASVAFVMIDTATSIINVHDRYIDTAYTLGASRWQIIRKVLFPLALPAVFDSARLLFGLAFGYIMLAELVQDSSGYPGLGGIISTSQRRGQREHITLILLLIPIMALAIDRLLFFIQRQLFPYRYGGSGYLHQAVRAALRTWEDFTSFFLRSRRYTPPGFTQPPTSGGVQPPTSSR